MLAAFDASLPQDGIESNDVTVEVNSIPEHSVGSSVITSLIGSEDEQREHCDISCCKARLSYVSSCTSSEIDASRRQNMPDVSKCHVQSLDDSSDHVIKEGSVSDAKVDSASNSELNVANESKSEASEATLSVASFQAKSAGRLSERIRRTLQQNAKVDTPTRLNRLSAVMEKSGASATDITDIWQLYGLPLEVKQLLQTQRSIKEFYRKFPFVVLFISQLLLVVFWSLDIRNNTATTVITVITIIFGFVLWAQWYSRREQMGIFGAFLIVWRLFQ